MQRTARMTANRAPPTLAPTISGSRSLSGLSVVNIVGKENEEGIMSTQGKCTSNNSTLFSKETELP